jgi:DNA-directed RNA polymerase subunit RPC12/RpoP
MGPEFAARYPGECSDCGFDFDEGDPVRFNEDDELVCGHCGDKEASKYRGWTPQGAAPDARDRRVDHG